MSSRRCRRQTARRRFRRRDGDPIRITSGYAVAVQADGKILVADGDFKLMRLNGDGSFDTGFGVPAT